MDGSGTVLMAGENDEEKSGGGVNGLAPGEIAVSVGISKGISPPLIVVEVSVVVINDCASSA